MLHRHDSLSALLLWFWTLIGVVGVGGAATPYSGQAQSVTADSGGFRILSDDGAYQLRIGGDVHADSRFQLNDVPGASNEFLTRRARIRLRGIVENRFGVQLMTDFGRGRTTLQDAFIDFRFASSLSLRAGSFKTPMGLEFLQSPNALIQLERGYPTSFIPNRDVGIQVDGSFWERRAEYAIGVFNGAPDGTSVQRDVSNAKDVVGRVFVTPWQRDQDSVLQGLGVGIAASYGNEFEDGRPLPTYTTRIGSPLFAYRGNARPDGQRTRLMPQFSYYAGSFGVIGELAWSRHAVTDGDEKEALAHYAWQIGATWFATGEQASFGTTGPAAAYDPDEGTWGAFEISAKMQRVSFSDDAFPAFANPNEAIGNSTIGALGLNWYPVRNVRLMVVVEHTRFGGTEGADARNAETTLGTRFQIAY